MDSSFFIHCDELEHLPTLHKDNWLREIDLLKELLPGNARVLQVGCMDGTRIIRLHAARPDLHLTGIDIDEDLLTRARENCRNAGLSVPLLHGDITQDSDIGMFDVVVCLNNTLGWIEDCASAIRNMRLHGKTVMVSVYGERFTDDVAREYFATLGLSIENVLKNAFSLRNVGIVRRFTRSEIDQWNGECTETPLGTFCILRSNL